MKKLLLSIGTICVLLGCSKVEKTHEVVVKEPNFQSNFYMTVNKEWLNGVWISPSMPGYNEFTRLQIENNDILRQDIEKLVSGEIEATTSDQIEFIKLYKKGFNYSARREDGIDSSLPYLEEMKAIRSFDELQRNLENWIMSDYKLPFQVNISSDPRNRQKHIIRIDAPKLQLFNKSIPEENRDKIVDSYRFTAGQILTHYGYNKSDIEDMIENSIQFEAHLSSFLTEDSTSYEPIHDKSFQSIEDLNAISSNWKLGDKLSALVSERVDSFYITNPEYLENLNKILSADNFEEFYDWSLVNQMMAWAPYMTGELMSTVGIFSAEAQGQIGSLPNDYVTFLQVTSLFKDTLSVYYGQNYLEPGVKESVTEMTENIITTFKNRILSNQWLSVSTKEMAVKKLENLDYYIGYQEKVSDDTKLIKVDDNLSYAQNILGIIRQKRVSTFSRYGEPVDTTSWASSISSSDSAAAYSPYQNAIYIPAGNLRAPFYDKNQSVEQNYAALGDIIAHEVTHALDSNGANFDDSGNLLNWWTSSDRKIFEGKVQDMKELFDGIERYGEKIDGEISLYENIADLGGITIALETLKTIKPDADLKTFFEHFAMSRREQVSDAHGRYILRNDPHSLEELRVNLQLQQLDDFHIVYETRKGDSMYRAPEDRIVIW